MTIYTFAFLSALVAVILTIPRSSRAQWAAMGIIAQTMLSYGLFYASQDPLHHAVLFCLMGLIYLFYSAWTYGAALGLCSFLICLNFVGGYIGIISVETGKGVLSPTVWNYKTILCYTQIVILWTMGNGIRNRIHID